MGIFVSIKFRICKGSLTPPIDFIMNSSCLVTIGATPIPFQLSLILLISSSCFCVKNLKVISTLLFCKKYEYSPLTSVVRLKSFILISDKSIVVSNSFSVLGSVNVNLYSEPNAVFLKNIKIACLSSSTISSILISLSKRYKTGFCILFSVMLVNKYTSIHS